jgi:hypothetical protein
MELTLLNSDLQNIATIDTYESLIWTDRYYKYGDFEITDSPSSQFIQQHLKNAAFASIRESPHLMVVEYFNIRTDVDSGDKAIVKGRSLESILDRRVVWSPTLLQGNFQASMQQLLEENAINPALIDRKIQKLQFTYNNDPTIVNRTVDIQYAGETLYNCISHLCSRRGLGFRILPTATGMFNFEFYNGKNRSYDQTTNPYVVFSPDSDNLVNADYIESNQALKNVALIGGEEGVGNARLYTSIGYGLDLNRREIFVDASDVTRTTSNYTLTDAEYLEQLQEKGEEELSRNSYIQAFEGQVDLSHTYTYGVDFSMGDILQVADRYGHEAKSRVVELVRSQDQTGIKIYPTFGSFNLQ